MGLPNHDQRIGIIGTLAGCAIATGLYLLFQNPYVFGCIGSGSVGYSLFNVQKEL